MSSNELLFDELKQFAIFNSADLTKLQTIINDVSISWAAKGQTIIVLGDTSEFGYFLLSGTLILKAADGGVRTIVSGTEAAKNQIAQLVPRRYQVIAATRVSYLKIPNALLNAFSFRDGNESNIILNEGAVLDESNTGLTNSDVVIKNEISYQLYQDLQNDKLVLPSLPDIALRVGRALRDENSSAHQIAAIAQTDTAIAAKLIKAANSAMYGGSKKVDNCSAAVVRLGTDLTHKLVMTFALKDLFNTSSKLLNHHMKRLWDHSTKVAAIAHVLAIKLGKFHPEEALLAGLVHDIGTLAILNYALDFPEAQNSRKILDNVIHSLRGQIGTMILRNWGFPDGLHEVALDAENWMRNPESAPDYTDIVIIAQLHSFIGSPKHEKLPPIDSVPAFSRLKLGKLTPKMTLKILDEAKEEIAGVRALLRA